MKLLDAFMKQRLTIRKPLVSIAPKARSNPAGGSGGHTVAGTHGPGRTRARSARSDRGALDRLDPGHRTARQDLAAGHAVVPGELPVLHHPDRLRRPRAGPVPGLVDPGRRA